MQALADDELRTTFVGQMRLVPGAVAIVASAIEGERTGLAATAWNSLCADPPMLVVCINRSASAHPLIQRARAFSVNLLAADQVETVAIFSKQRGLEGAARFAPGRWIDGPKGQPMLEDAVAAFECELVDAHDYGTHTILIGRVGGMRSRSDSEAMVYLDGCFASAVRAL
jgi:flavin reductase (DIM6/NTAB) family NADH-FMN oxidoreductase RutF